MSHWRETELAQFRDGITGITEGVNTDRMSLLRSPLALISGSSGKPHRLKPSLLMPDVVDPLLDAGTFLASETVRAWKTQEDKEDKEEPFLLGHAPPSSN